MTARLPTAWIVRFLQEKKTQRHKDRISIPLKASVSWGAGEKTSQNKKKRGLRLETMKLSSLSRTTLLEHLLPRRFSCGFPVELLLYYKGDRKRKKRKQINKEEEGWTLTFNFICRCISPAWAVCDAARRTCATQTFKNLKHCQHRNYVNEL